MRYRKTPVIVDAWPVKDILNFAANSWKDLPLEVIEGYEEGELIFASDSIHIKTPDGIQIAYTNDILLMGLRNQFYGCKKETFELLYEPIGE